MRSPRGTSCLKFVIELAGAVLSGPRAMRDARGGVLVSGQRRSGAAAGLFRARKSFDGQTSTAVRQVFAWLLTLAVLAAPPAHGVEPVRILTMADPFALVIRERTKAFEALAGAPLELELTSYGQLRERILLNAFQAHSRFDLIALDVGWATEVAAAEVALSLDRLVGQRDISTDSFLDSALRGATVNGQLIGLPVQPHTEVLFVDQALLDSRGLEPPRTTNDLLSLARSLHGIREGIAGLCWNAQRGPALGQTMLHFLAAFGGRPLDRAGRPTLDTPELRAATQFAVELLEVSPPDILTMAWDQRIYAFGTGRCAMTYGWTGRTMLLERFGFDLASGRFAVAPAPHAPGVAPVSPLGVWLLAVPANLAPERREKAFTALAGLTSIEANRLYAGSGVGALLHTRLADDTAVTSRNPAVALMGQLEREDQLAEWIRPAIAGFQGLTEILGTEIHAVLSGTQSIDEAVRAAQASFARLLED